jgi:hypothetical protein
MKKKLYKLFLLLLFCQLQVVAQTEGFNYEAAIQLVDSSGFYNIVLTPELNAHLKTDYSDLRIVNDSGRWVPHLVRNLGGGFTDPFIIWDLKTIRKENDSKKSVLIVSAKDSVNSNIVLFITNTVAERFCTVSGSNDMTSWFAINDSILIDPERNTNKTEILFDINFPPCSYRFLKIEIINNDKNPINITHAGTRGVISPAARFGGYSIIENPACTIQQKDSGKISVLKVEQPLACPFEVISLQISGVKYFKRGAYLYVPGSDDHVVNDPKAAESNMALSNNSSLQFRFRKNKAKVFYIYVYNEDNLPLKIEDIKTFISYRVATVYLEKTNHYKLLVDNATAMLPDYDISEKDFQGEKVIPSANIMKIVSLQKPTLIEPKSNSSTLIWLAISLAAIVLAFFTYRLVTDMNKSKA